ncbi:MAG: hypothetical protein MR743_07775 [Oscillospiraceae bacterium]|uniref:hypothetical protein n=1 Tax=Allofournierella TaxID=1940255 RepID=UPI0015ABCEA6|nr:hypothetical protein [Fournierella sp.]MCI6959725.1 hypothetical protein [Oscillospiraceae bacterium]MEE0756988.1 hypothetical protein [Fournierella sp.]
MDNRNTKTSSQNAKTTSQNDKTGAKNMVPNPVNAKTTNTAKNSSKNCMGGKGTK